MAMKRTMVAAAMLAAFIPAAGALAQAQAPAAKAPAKADTAKAAPSSDKVLYTQSQFDFMLKERLAQGGQDTPEIRNALKEELNTRELLAREAKKQGIDKSADMK